MDIRWIPISDTPCPLSRYLTWYRFLLPNQNSLVQAPYWVHIFVHAKTFVLSVQVIFMYEPHDQQPRLSWSAQSLNHSLSRKMVFQIRFKWRSGPLLAKWTWVCTSYDTGDIMIDQLSYVLYLKYTWNVIKLKSLVSSTKFNYLTFENWGNVLSDLINIDILCESLHLSARLMISLYLLLCTFVIWRMMSIIFVSFDQMLMAHC